MATAALTPIYAQYGYTAQVSPDGTCVVHRSSDMGGYSLTAHVGEKLPSQDWREVTLMGCPHDIRVEIIKAWQDWSSK